MATDANAANIYLGRGKVFFDRLVSDLPTGERLLGNVTELSITTTDEVREKFSSVVAAAPLLKRAVVRRTPELTIKMDEFSMKNMALIVMGNEGEYLQTGGVGAGTDEVLTASANAGVWYKFADREVSNVVVEDDTPTAYTIDTDYILDLDVGMVYIVPGGGCVGNDVQVDYDSVAITTPGREAISGGEASIIEGLLRFIGDPAAGPVWELEAWKVTLNPDGALNFIGDDFGEFTVKAGVLDDAINHPAWPLYRLIKRA